MFMLRFQQKVAAESPFRAGSGKSGMTEKGGSGRRGPQTVMGPGIAAGPHCPVASGTPKRPFAKGFFEGR